MNRAINLPGKVAVIAQATTLAGLGELSDILILHECGLDQMPGAGSLGDADIIVAEVDPVHEGSIRRLDQIAAARPDLPIIAGVDGLDIRTTRALLKRGVTDCLEIPFSIQDLLDALADVDLSAIRAAEEQTRLAPVVSFFGCAGGVGTTTIATHFAAAASEAGLGSAMLDLDIQKGDICEYLGMGNRLSLQDIIEADKRLDTDLLASVLTHREGMPDVLAAPQDILPIEEVQFEQIEPVIDMLRNSTGLVTIDMPNALTNWGLSTLYASQRVILVGSMTVPLLRKMRRQIDFLISMGIHRDTIKVVLNRVETGLFKTIRTSEAEAALRHPIFVVLPEEPANLQQAQDQGELLWSLARRTRFEKALRVFTDELIDEIEAES